MILKIILFALAGLFNAVMDKLQFHYSTSIFPQNDTDKLLGGSELFWNPDKSWKNKYKDWDGGDKRAKFPLSKTALVFLTDGWHLFQFFMLSCFAAACTPKVEVWYMWFVWFLSLRAAFGLVFTLVFHKLLGRNDLEST